MTRLKERTRPLIQWICGNRTRSRHCVTSPRDWDSWVPLRPQHVLSHIKVVPNQIWRVSDECWCIVHHCTLLYSVVQYFTVFYIVLQHWTVLYSILKYFTDFCTLVQCWIHMYSYVHICTYLLYGIQNCCTVFCTLVQCWTHL